MRLLCEMDTLSDPMIRYSAIKPTNAVIGLVIESKCVDS